MQKFTDKVLPFSGLPVMAMAVVSEQRGNGLDHNLITIGLFIVGLIIAILGILMRGWFKHVNTTLDRLWEHLTRESEARERRWDTLHEKCEQHTGQIAELKGRLNGKAKVFGALKLEGDQ